MHPVLASIALGGKQVQDACTGKQIHRHVLHRLLAKQAITLSPSRTL